MLTYTNQEINKLNNVLIKYKFNILSHLFKYFVKYINKAFVSNSNSFIVVSLPLDKSLISNNMLFFLGKSSLMRFNMLVDFSMEDRLLVQSKYRFLAFYVLLSVSLNVRINVLIPLQEYDFLPTVTTLFYSANWLEREVYDMFGFWFTNHPDFRRILTDYGFSGYPLRKDFPLTGFYELFFDEALSLIQSVDVELSQEAKLSSTFKTFLF